MNVIEKNKGEKISYKVSGNKITFGDDEITLNLEKYERDTSVQIDICRDDEQLLVAGPSKYFVANVIIPARRIDEAGEVIPFDMDRVTLVLWSLIEINVEV